MSISTAQLEALQHQLAQLARRLADDRRPPSAILTATDPEVAEASACDFLLPSPLTLEALRETVQKKQDNVVVLLARAKLHEALPADAQAAAEEENAFMEADYDTPPTTQRDEPGTAGG